MLSRLRHSSLVEPLLQQGGLVRQRGPFSMYWLNGPDGCDAQRAPELVIVHDLVPERIDNNIGRYVVHDLLPMIQQVRAEYGAVAIYAWPSGTSHEVYTTLVGMVVWSIHADVRIAWRWFYQNTLDALADGSSDVDDPTDFIGPFRNIYRRIADLWAGDSLLDVGTSHGFLPLLLSRWAGAGRAGGVRGVDKNSFLIRIARAQAAEQRLPARFDQVDLFEPAADRLPRFDTVTALHLLEHLPMRRTEDALERLWQLTGKRLIVNVPIEAEPNAEFGHEQVFDVPRLERLGSRLDADTRCFEFHGAWLVADRR
ncbi:MAG: class I SAM-dependent methyltransferase [Micromonosporaceae bacterium]|nr:class I SAM-dependent methyltransferase [Micromonosporaceae bacterium]